MTKNHWDYEKEEAEAVTALYSYLLAHENDIKHSINDFGDLKLAFEYFCKPLEADIG